MPIGISGKGRPIISLGMGDVLVMAGTHEKTGICIFYEDGNERHVGDVVAMSEIRTKTNVVELQFHCPESISVVIEQLELVRNKMLAKPE